jgi:para-nitrobenzyl esterase
MYLLTWESDFLGGLFKSGHGIEIPLVFDIAADVPLAGSAPGTNEMASAMSEAWIAFARSGNPNHPGIPEWPAYSAANRATMLFDRPAKVVIDPFREELDVWEGMKLGR